MLILKKYIIQTRSRGVYKVNSEGLESSNLRSSVTGGVHR